MDPVICPGGNCPGCQEGEIWCQDPRCFPNCPGDVCMIPEDYNFTTNVVIACIIVCLFVILFIVWFAYGPKFFFRHGYKERIVFPIESP